MRRNNELNWCRTVLIQLSYGETKDYPLNETLVSNQVNMPMLLENVSLYSQRILFVMLQRWAIRGSLWVFWNQRKKEDRVKRCLHCIFCLLLHRLNVMLQKFVSLSLKITTDLMNGIRVTQTPFEFPNQFKRRKLSSCLP